ncbi:hypothetical protein MASR2M64_04170 [Candidatus Cloacimonadota bacterium]
MLTYNYGGDLSQEKRTYLQALSYHPPLIALNKGNEWGMLGKFSQDVYKAFDLQLRCDKLK